jgi:thymidylate kinase
MICAPRPTGHRLCKPDLTVLIDLDVKSAANERRVRDAKDRFETSDLEFHQRVRDGYLEWPRVQRLGWFVVDGSVVKRTWQRSSMIVATYVGSRG